MSSVLVVMVSPFFILCMVFEDIPCLKISSYSDMFFLANVSNVDEYPNLDLIGNARHDSVIYDLAPQPTGRRGRPAKHGCCLSMEEDFTLSEEKTSSYFLGESVDAVKLEVVLCGKAVYTIFIWE